MTQRYKTKSRLPNFLSKYWEITVIIPKIGKTTLSLTSPSETILQKGIEIS